MVMNFPKRKENIRQCTRNCTKKAVSILTKLVLVQVIFLIISAIPVFSSEKSIRWSEDELNFMEKHPVIRMGVDSMFVPFEFIDQNGEYKGIAADYIDLISKKTGLRFEIVKGLSWPEVYEKALAGEVDVLPVVGKTYDRQKYFLFSEPYYYYKRVIVTRDTDTGISGIEDLKGSTVAVQRNSSHHSYLLSYPEINLSLYDSVESALTAVATGTEKAFIGNLASTNYLIRMNGLTNLRFVSFEAEKQHSLHFAVRKDWPELVSIINKALNSISVSEKLAITNKWVELETDLDYRPIIRIAAIAGSLTAVVLIVSFFWIARLRKEIKRRKQIQLDLEKAKHEADKANNFKSLFMARMSHEIRTSLNAIIGMAYLMRKTELSLTQNMYIERIQQAANNMLSIIDDILDFSKIEAGKAGLDIVSFSLDQVIRNVVNIVSYKIDEQGISFSFTKDPRLPDWFLGDPRRIEQILLNVLNNAAKFTEKGEVSLDVRLLAKEKDKYHIEFIVKDTGIGMTEEQLGRLFRPFEQGDASIGRKFGGSGLGMSIVKSLMDMMGGEIEVFSTPGEGSTFVLRISLRIDRDKETASARAAADKQLKDIKVLILENSGESINLIGSYLKSCGMQCEITSSELSAISTLEAVNGYFSRPFDLLIIDYETPAEGGFNFIEKLRKNSRIISFPKVLMILPMMKNELFDRLKEYGVDAAIEKPVIPSVLIDSIMDIFGLKAVSPAGAYDNVSPVGTDRPYRVLLVEDNGTNQLIAEPLLKQAGIETITASNGKEAVELYLKYKNSIDMILMDLHMPAMDGYEAAEKIRQVSADVPIAALTADVVEGIREKCEQYGMSYLISKPFNPDRFIQTVKDILSDRSSRIILDMQQGIRNMGNNAELYQQVLEKYRNENRDTLEKLDLAVREKRFADAAEIVHRIKSSSGSIGARPVYETAVALQKALEKENEKEILPLYTKFSDFLRRLLELLDNQKTDLK